MKKIIEVLRLKYEAKLSHEKIARASGMASDGLPRLVTSRVLNHVDTGVTAVYDRHSYDAEKRDALARILHQKERQNPDSSIKYSWLDHYRTRFCR